MKKNTLALSCLILLGSFAFALAQQSYTSQISFTVTPSLWASTTTVSLGSLKVNQSGGQTFSSFVTWRTFDPAVTALTISLAIKETTRTVVSGERVETAIGIRYVLGRTK